MSSYRRVVARLRGVRFGRCEELLLLGVIVVGALYPVLREAVHAVAPILCGLPAPAGAAAGHQALLGKIGCALALPALMPAGARAVAGFMDRLDPFVGLPDLENPHVVPVERFAEAVARRNADANRFRTGRGLGADAGSSGGCEERYRSEKRAARRDAYGHRSSLSLTVRDADRFPLRATPSCDGTRRSLRGFPVSARERLRRPDDAGIPEG